MYLPGATSKGSLQGTPPEYSFRRPSHEKHHGRPPLGDTLEGNLFRGSLNNSLSGTPQ